MKPILLCFPLQGLQPHFPREVIDESAKATFYVNKFCKKGNTANVSTEKKDA